MKQKCNKFVFRCKILLKKCQKSKMLQISFKFVSFNKTRNLASQATFSDFVAFFKKYYKNFLENINFKKVFNKIFEICNKAKNWLKIG